MASLGDHLPFRVEQWDAASTRIETILAAAADLKLAKAVFAEAVRLHPTSAYCFGSRRG